MTITAGATHPPSDALADRYDELRQRLRDFIAERAPSLPYRTGTRTPEDAEEEAQLRAWGAALYEAGFYGRSWPVEHGGVGASDPMDDFIVSEELSRARVPTPFGAGSLAAHALIHHGTDEQRSRLLPKIRSYDHVWCQLFSEPDAGSDLAGLRTTAVRHGDHFVVNGQKVWSTNAAFADYGYLLARTDPAVSKHRGITAFALDMHTPGVTVRPLREMTGTSDFNEVFFDDARVPASDVIGEINDGWTVATFSLAEERSGQGSHVAHLSQAIEALIGLAKRTHTPRGLASNDPNVRQDLAALYSRVRILSMMSRATVERSRLGRLEPKDASIAKVVFSELNEDMSVFGIDLQGMFGMLAIDEPMAVDGGAWQDELLYAKAYTISGGSNEIMRNLLGERALGLPREPRPA